MKKILGREDNEYYMLDYIDDYKPCIRVMEYITQEQLDDENDMNSIYDEWRDAVLNNGETCSLQQYYNEACNSLSIRYLLSFNDDDSFREEFLDERMRCDER